MWLIAYRSTRHVGRHRGTLPVVLACPHDGGAALPVPERTGSGLPPRCHFTKSRDFQATAITTGIAQRLFELRGEAPYVVFAEFHRKYVDVNRSADCAYEAAAARPYYEEYHRTLRGFVDEVRAESGGRGLLFDIHGTACIASDPADLYLATTAGRSVARRARPRRAARGRGICRLARIRPRSAGTIRSRLTAARTRKASTRSRSRSSRRCARVPPSAAS